MCIALDIRISSLPPTVVGEESFNLIKPSTININTRENIINNYIYISLDYIQSLFCILTFYIIFYIDYIVFSKKIKSHKKSTSYPKYLQYRPHLKYYRNTYYYIINNNNACLYPCNSLLYVIYPIFSTFLKI